VVEDCKVEVERMEENQDMALLYHSHIVLGC
jgi:hypothetical protein